MTLRYRTGAALLLLAVHSGLSAHDYPVGHLGGVFSSASHSHGVLDGLFLPIALGVVCSVALLVRRRARDAKWQRARRAIPVVLLRPEKRLFRGR